jgi:hypothetical protein
MRERGRHKAEDWLMLEHFFAGGRTTVESGGH